MGEGSGRSGRLFVISGPSGAGKSTLVRLVIRRPEAKAFLSVSATTRPIRPGETDGVDYLFQSREQFESEREAGRFLEWAEVHGNLYGTPWGPVQSHLDRGENVLLEIDVQGAMQVRERCPEAVLVFINTPDFARLEERLRARATDDERTIQQRLVNARRELEMVSHYPHVVVNDNLDRAVEEMTTILSQDSNGE